MAALTILITNTVLKGRTGTEIVVRDLALGLRRRGHRPIVYSPEQGDLAAMLIAEGVAVVDNLDRVALRPDVIHGHHTLETTAALLRFPDTPAIFVCHGWESTHDEPPIAPMVRRYLAVDHTCRDRLTCREGIPAERVGVLGNAVDLDRFPPRGPLPAQPRRGLIFSNYVSEGNALPVIREGCRLAGLPIDLVGERLGNFQAAPERMLGEYDIVFGKARCALEAMAVGLAVVVCDAGGFAGLVTSANFDRLRALNFGLRALKESVVTPERVADAIARYDAVDAARVHQRARQAADLETWLDQLISIYLEVKDDCPRDEDRSALLAFAGRQLVRTYIEVRKYHDIHRQATDLTEWGYVLQRDRDAIARDRDRLAQELAQERDALAEQRNALAAQVKGAAREREALAEALAAAHEERDRLAAELRDLRGSRIVRLGERVRRALRQRPTPSREASSASPGQTARSDPQT